MFPPVRTRTRAALLRAMDRAIEFATLGEYGLEVPGADAPAPGSGRSASSVGRRPGAVASEGSPSRRLVAAQRAFCVAAATPAGRRGALPAPDATTREAASAALVPPDPATREAASAALTTPDPATRDAPPLAMAPPDPATRAPGAATRVPAPAVVVSRVPGPRVRQRGGSVPPAPHTCVGSD